jgi:hypothetical protein
VRSGIDGDKRIAHLSFTLENAFSSRAFALVQGGWFPSGLACNTATTVLLDRNLIYEIIRRFDRGKPRSTESDILHLITGWPVRINPILFAMEGKERRFPTPEEMHNQLEWAREKLSVALPDAVVAVARKLYVRRSPHWRPRESGSSENKLSWSALRRF